MYRRMRCRTHFAYNVLAICESSFDRKRSAPVASFRCITRVCVYFRFMSSHRRRRALPLLRGGSSVGSFFMADAQSLSMANDKHFQSSKSVTSIAVIFGCASICCKRLSFASESFRHAHLPLYVGAVWQCELAASTHGWRKDLRYSRPCNSFSESRRAWPALWCALSSCGAARPTVPALQERPSSEQRTPPSPESGRHPRLHGSAGCSR